MGVNTTSRRIILWILNATAAFVGRWALFFPRGFHDSFPGSGFAAWVAHEGPFNEHLSVLSIPLLFPGRATRTTIEIEKEQETTR